MRAHSLLSASGAHRWMNCPGSVAAERDLPDRSSPDAIEGTAAHLLAERALLSGRDADHWLGREIYVRVQDCMEPVRVTEEMVDAVQMYVDYVRQHTPEDRRVEVRVDLQRLRPPGPMYGTVDVVAYDSVQRKLHVVDFKFGAGVVVRAENNPQMLYYALATVLTLNVRPRRIMLTVVQPRAPYPDGPIRTWECTWERLRQFRGELMVAAKMAWQKGAPRIAGDWCRFCKALPTCPEPRKLAVQVARTEFAAMDTPAELPSPAELTVEQLALVLAKAGIIEDWLRSVRSYVRARLERGDTLPGWKLVAGRSLRRWEDTDEAERVLYRLLGEDAYESRKLITVAEAERRLKNAGMQLPADLVTRPPGKLTLVPEKDVRPALPPGAQIDFADATVDTIPLDRGVDNG